MKTWLHGCVWSCVLMSAAWGQPEWTLDRAMRTALENSPDAMAARERYLGAEAMLVEAKSYGAPQLSLESSYTRTNSPMMAFGSILNQRAFDFGMDFNRPGDVDNLNATATIGMNLYAGGKVRSGRRAAEAGMNAARLDEASERQKLLATVVDSYLNIRKTREAVRAVESGVKAFEAAVSNAQARRDAGQMLEADLLSLEVQLAQTRENLSQATNYQALAERAFLFALGLEADAGPVKIAAEDPGLDRLVEPDQLDFSDRPELRALRERESAAAAMVDVARAGNRPSVNGFASYQWDKGWETGESGDAWLGGIAVNLNVFDGGTTKAKVRQAEAQLAELRENIRKAELGMGLEVEQARLALELARERVAVTELSLSQAEESARLTRARFEAGGVLTAELIGVEGRLMEARMRRAVALADEHIAIVALRRAVGAPLVEQ